VRVALRCLANEDFRGKIVRGLKRRLPDLDIVRVQDVGLARRADPAVLEWAAGHRYIIVTHDSNTMTAHAYARLRARLQFPGVCVIPQSMPIGRAIDDLVGHLPRELMLPVPEITNERNK
jgi:uncharacterized protein DUF5615